MVWFLGQKANSLTGSAWADSLQAWDALEYVVADAGRPLQAGIGFAPRINGVRTTKSPWHRAWMSSTPSTKPAKL